MRRFIANKLKRTMLDQLPAQFDRSDASTFALICGIVSWGIAPWIIAFYFAWAVVALVAIVGVVL